MMFYMVTKAKLTRNVPRWQGCLDASLFSPEMRSAGHQLADFAKAGKWADVFMMLEDDKNLVVPYQWRPGGKEWFTVLHQAAWHGAPLTIVDKLIKRRALRSLLDAEGHLPFEIAQKRGHPHLLSRLQPPKSLVQSEIWQQLNLQFCNLIFDLSTNIIGGPSLFDQQHSRITEILRCPPVEILLELPGQRVWFPIPGTDEGFQVSLRHGFLEVIGWEPGLTGGGSVHVVTPFDAIPINSEFSW